MNNFKEAKPRQRVYYCWSQSLMHLRWLRGWITWHEYWQLQYGDNPLRNWSQLFTHNC